MVARDQGPLEEAWRESGLPAVALPGLRHAWLFTGAGVPPVVLLPADAVGRRREELFGWATAELDRREGGRAALVARLRAQRPEHPER
jgi:hypothetical protein